MNCYRVVRLGIAHSSNFNQFRVAFQMRPFETNGGAQTKRIAILNEQHATLLMTLMRNTERVVIFKVALVKAFFEARELLKTDYFSLVQRHSVLCAKLDIEKDMASQCGKGLSLWKQKRDCLQLAIVDVERHLQPCLGFDKS